MLLRWSAALLSLSAAANAFKNAAPFFMVSSESFETTLRSSEVRSAEEVQSGIAQAYADGHCKKGKHVIISQPGLTVGDLHNMTRLAKVATDKAMPWQIYIPNVLGDLDAETIKYDVSNLCGIPKEMGEKESGSKSKVSFFRGETLPEDEKKRKIALEKLDSDLHQELSKAPKSGPFVIILASTPAVTAKHPTQHYESDQTDPSLRHQELKREIIMRASNSSGGNQTSDDFQAGLPLFEQYQYLSPALFMGLSVSILLFIILYFAISAVAGLEVSYMAFSKEMAPQNQKKQQ